MSFPDLELGPIPPPSLSLETERTSPPPTKGFIAVTSKITSDPDKSTTIYRRFDALSARNLLFYQAELAELEDLQKQYDEDDRKARDAASIECQREWDAFVRCAREEGREKSKMDLAMRIREVLAKYHEALTKHQTLLNTPPAAKTTIKAMQNWFCPVNSKPHLWGASERIYFDPHDLVALRVPADHDRLLKFIQNNFGIFFAYSSSNAGSGGNQLLISHPHLSTFTAVLSTALAFLLLFGATASLYFVKNPTASLCMVGGWTMLFAVCIGILTNAKRDQIFAATAAYAAVLVVFVSGNLSGVGARCGCVSG